MPNAILHEVALLDKKSSTQMITACSYTTNRQVGSAPSFSKIAGVELQRGWKMFGEVGPVVAAGIDVGFVNDVA